jgi:adenosine kinase
MAAVICGSLAFDTIMTFEGRFADQILPDQLHILNVSFLVPALRRDFGGCAGNIAYSLNALGGTALPMATVGSDGADTSSACGRWASAPSSCARSTIPSRPRP